MSRFPELFEEAIEAVVGTEALHVEALAEDIARHIVGRQSALRAEARITAQWPVRRTTPVSKLSTQEMVSLVGIAAATADARAPGRRRRGDRDQRLPVCAGSRPRPGRRAAGRGRLRGRRADPRPRAARDPQPARARLALRRHRQAARRERPGRGRAGVDERTDLRAAEAARRALRRRARAPAAPLRRGLRPALDQGRPRGDAGSRRRRLRLRTPDQLRDDPRARRPRRARGNSRRAPRRARSAARRPGGTRASPTGSPAKPGFGPRRKSEAALGPRAQARDVRPCAGRAPPRPRSRRRRSPATAPRARARRRGARRR